MSALAKSRHSVVPSSVQFHQVIRLPSLVEELDPGAVKSQRYQKIPTVDGLDPVRVRRSAGLRRAESRHDRLWESGFAIVKN